MIYFIISPKQKDERESRPSTDPIIILSAYSVPVAELHRVTVTGIMPRFLAPAEVSERQTLYYILSDIIILPIMLFQFITEHCDASIRSTSASAFVLMCANPPSE